MFPTVSNVFPHAVFEGISEASFWHIPGHDPPKVFVSFDPGGATTHLISPFTEQALTTALHTACPVNFTADLPVLLLWDHQCLRVASMLSRREKDGDLAIFLELRLLFGPYVFCFAQKRPPSADYWLFYVILFLAV